MKSVLFIVGPTGSGKSKLAMELALELCLPILNGDSIQVYRRLEIGSAKPSQEQRERVPHFLFDLVSPPQEFTAGDFRREALKVLAHLFSASSGPAFSSAMIVGGSGFYLQALQKGMYEVEQIDDSVRISLKEELTQVGLSSLFSELKARDPELAEKINPHDSYRILRSLAVMRTHRKSLTEIRKKFHDQKQEVSFPYRWATLALDVSRPILRKKLKIRALQMLDNGFIEEVQVLREEGFENWPPLQSVGYREIKNFLVDTHMKKKINLSSEQKEKLVESITTSSMQLAKRQVTWWRRDKSIYWFDANQEWEKAKHFAKNFLCRNNGENR